MFGVSAISDRFERLSVAKALILLDSECQIKTFSFPPTNPSFCRFISLNPFTYKRLQAVASNKFVRKVQILLSEWRVWNENEMLTFDPFGGSAKRKFWWILSRVYICQNEVSLCLSLCVIFFYNYKIEYFLLFTQRISKLIKLTIFRLILNCSVCKWSTPM